MTHLTSSTSRPSHTWKYGYKNTKNPQWPESELGFTQKKLLWSPHCVRFTAQVNNVKDRPIISQLRSGFEERKLLGKPTWFAQIAF